MVNKPRRRRRRSEMRLGMQPINYEYEATAVRPRLKITPVLKFWQTRGTKLTGLAALVLLGWAFYTLFSEPRFFVLNAQIQGNVAVSTQEIYETSGIDGQSIFWVNSEKVVEQITSIPNIKSAVVSVALPAEVVIEVIERRPELLWQSGDMVWWVDQEGVIVPPKDDAATGMLRIVDDDLQQLEAGFQIDPAIVEGAQTLHLLVPDVSVMRYSRSQGLAVSTPEGWPVYLGDGSEIKAKLVVLTALLADLKERNITPVMIDVRDPLRPFYKPQSVIQIAQPPKEPPSQLPPTAPGAVAPPAQPR
jgi:cell division septal protein FtsQ